MSDNLSPEKVSRFSNDQFIAACQTLDSGIQKDDVLVLHFTSPDNMQKILAPDSKGLRASKVGQLGGGLSVVQNVECFLLMWHQNGASPWPEKVGRALWGEDNGKKVWLGNPDHRFIECVFVLSIPAKWVDETSEHCRVPGRPYVRILQTRFLTPGGDSCHYLTKDHIIKAYDLRPSADEFSRQVIRKQLSASGLRWSQVRAEASDLGVSEKELREFDNADHPLVECFKRFRELEVELFEPRGASMLMCQDYDRLRVLAKHSGARDSLVGLADDAGSLEDRKRILTLYLLVLSQPETPPTPTTCAPLSSASSVSSSLDEATFELLDEDKDGLHVSDEDPNSHLRDRAARVMPGMHFILQEDSHIFASAKSWDLIGHVRAGQSVSARGPVHDTGDFLMVPIHPEGVIELDLLEEDPNGHLRERADRVVPGMQFILQEDSHIFASAKSWDLIGHARAGQRISARGPVHDTGDFLMVPIHPEGTIELDLLEEVCHGRSSQCSEICRISVTMRPQRSFRTS